MEKAAHLRTGRMAALVLSLLLGVCLSGCSLLTPSRTEAARNREQVAPALDASSLVQEGVLTVALDTADAPQGMTGTDGEVMGYYADVARALAQRLGLKVAFVSATSASNSLPDGSADIFLGAAASASDDEVTVFGSCLEDAPALFVKDADAATVSASTLSTMTVGVQTSSAAADALAKAGVTAEQKAYANVNECFDALASGEVDCVACDATAGAYLARAYEGVGFAGTLGAVSVSGVAVLSSASDLSDEVSTAFEEIASDGTLSAVHAQWYGSLPSSLSDALVNGVTLSEDDGQDAPADTPASSSDSSSEVDLSDINRFDG